MQEISIHEIENIRIGQSENREAATGCTVLISEKGMAAGLDIRGGGPASRESGLLDPLASAECIHAVVLAGGSAFGLDAAGGVMAYLEEKNIGFDVGVTRVPLVCQADLFDLTVGSVWIRPDREMGRMASINAEKGNYRDGNFGAGCGASVGKLLGMDYAMKSGIGSYAVQIGSLKVGAVVAVNALGDVFDFDSGQKLAGLLGKDKKSFRDSSEILFRRCDVVENRFTSNTTIGAIVTNARFQKSQLCKIAGMAHDGLARTIRPVHTSADGDSLFAVSVGIVPADIDVVGALAADVVAHAVKNAVISADSAYGLIGHRDFFNAL